MKSKQFLPNYLFANMFSVSLISLRIHSPESRLDCRDRQLMFSIQEFFFPWAN